jgi:sugar phosphate permease
VLAAGTAAQASFSAITLGIPVLAPALREEYELTLSQIGIVLAAEWIGLIGALLPWGFAVDRWGERWMLPLGLTACAGFIAGAAFAPGFRSLIALIALAGAAGAAVQSGSGRAVMRWFGPEERGLALGLRQTAVPVGGVIGALGLPLAVAAGGVRAAFLGLAVLCVLGSLLAAAILRERASDEGLEVEQVRRTLRDGRLWLLCFGSGIYLVAQVAVLGFLVLFLHDERGFSTGRAALVLVFVNVLGGALRIGTGRWSDRIGTRLVPLRLVGLGGFASLVVVALLLGGPTALLVPAFVVAGGLSMAWNGLSFTAAAELAGAARSGAAIGFQQTVLSLIGIAVPIAFAATVDALSWQAAFALAALGPLVGWWALGRLPDHRPS